MELLEQMSEQLMDEDGLLDFVQKLKRINNDIMMQNNNIDSYILTNYNVLKRVVDEVVEIKNKGLIVEDHDYQLSQLNMRLNDISKYKSQVKRMKMVQKLFEQN